MRRLWLAALALAVLPGAAAAALSQAAPAPAKATPEEWTVALTALREIAMDRGQGAARRGNAVMAYAKLQSLRGRRDEAVKTCWEVLKSAAHAEVAQAAVRAACFACRNAQGHLGAAAELIRTWQTKAPPGPGKAALKSVQQDLIKMRQYVMGVAARRMPPMPIRVGLARWAVVRPKSGVAAVGFSAPKVVTPRWMAIRTGRGPSALEVRLPKIAPSPLLARDKAGVPSALRLTLPVYAPPQWYYRAKFPLLKESKK